MYVVPLLSRPVAALCRWSGICSTVRVVASTVPVRLTEGPQTYASRRIRLSHDVRQSVIRRQCACLTRRSRERVGVRLTATSPSRLICNESIQRGSPPTCVCPVCRAFRVGMGVVGQLLDRQRGLTHSAGNTRSWPRKLCQPPNQAVRMMYERT